MVDLREELLNRGLSIRSAAHEIGVPEQTLRRCLRGEGVHPGNAKKIADFFEVRVTDIWPLPDPEAEAA